MNDDSNRTDEEITAKRRRAQVRLTRYLDSLPNCLVGEYSADQRAEHERSQRRVLELCATDEDRAALIEFLIGFTEFIVDLKARLIKKDGKFYLPDPDEPGTLN